jgi:hypothetical protein
MSDRRPRRLTGASAEYGIQCGRDNGNCRTVKLEARYPRSRECLQQRSWVDMIGGEVLVGWNLGVLDDDICATWQRCGGMARARNGVQIRW